MSNHTKTELIALLPMVLGAFIVAMAIWGDDAGMHAPRWVVAAAGGVFVLAGLAILGQKLPRFSAFTTTLLVTLFGLVASWVAFGPGERQFTASVGLPFIGVSGAGSETLGRLCFAPGALVLDGLALVMWVRLVLGRDR